MKPADSVLQELWAIKDAEFAQAQRDNARFVQQLQAQSMQLREGLQLKSLPQPNASKKDIQGKRI